jgi:hypothetical protein
MATPIEFPCPRCNAREGEPCWTLTDGAMRRTPHDARRRKAGERIERRESTPRQRAAMELGGRHFVVSGAVGALERIVLAPIVGGWTEEDHADVRAAAEALGRIDKRRRERAFIRESNRRFAKEQDALHDADMLHR